MPGRAHPGTLASRWAYYLSSIPTLASGVRARPGDWLRLAAGSGKRPVLVELPRRGTRFFVRGPMDLWILKEICLDREYDWPGGALLPGTVFLDVGAGLGAFSVDLARVAPGIRIHAFEPCASSYELLERNILGNGVRSVQPHCEALGAKTGTAALYFNSRRPHLATTVAGLEADRWDSSAVRVRSLEDVLSGLPAAPVAVKLDCEGAEYDILLGAAEPVFSRIFLIVLEYHRRPAGPGPSDLVDFLAGMGYEVRTRPNPAHRHLGLLYARRDIAA